MRMVARASGTSTSHWARYRRPGVSDGLMQAVLLTRTPIPVVVIQLDGPVGTVPDARAVGLAVAQELGTYPRELRLSGCRAVDFDRLPRILERGIDVEPPDAVIWVECLAKALEYGGDTKAVMVFDPKRLHCTFQEVSAALAAHEIEALAAVYPTRVTSADGEMVWFSRLPRDDRRAASPYEVAFARWIPDDPWLALRLIIVVGMRGSDLPTRTARLLAKASAFAQAMSPGAA